MRTTRCLQTESAVDTIGQHLTHV